MNTNENTKKSLIFARPKKVIYLHWFNAASWLLLTFTGLGIIRGDLSFMPQGFAEWMQNFVAGQFNLIVGHSVFGVFWATVMLLFAAANWNAILKPFLQKVITLTPTSVLGDMRIMGVLIAQLFGLMKDAKLPPAGRYNGAQRLLGTLILVSSVIIVLTGAVMFGLFLFTELMINGAVFRWSLVLHGFFVGLVWIGLISHIYYSVVESPESMESMKSGYLDADFVKHHSPAWYEELKQEGKVP